MPFYTTVGYFEQGEAGWSEVWSRETSATDLLIVRDQTEPMWQKRVAMLGVETVFQGYRVSFDDILQDSILTYKNQPGPGPFHSAAADLTVYTLFYNTTKTRHKAVYVRGFDDNVSMNGGRFQQGANVAAWIGAYNDWRAFMVASGQGVFPYGWHSRTAVAPDNFEVLGYTVEVLSNRIVFQCSENTFPAGQLNTLQHVAVSKLGQYGKSVLNREWIVRVTGPDTCVTTKPVAVFPHRGEIGRIRRFNIAFTAAGSSLPQKIGRRTPGKISHSPVGRAAAKPLG